MLAASIIRVIIVLMLQTARTSKMTVQFYQTTRRNNPEVSHLQPSEQETSLNRILFKLYTHCTQAIPKFLLNKQQEREMKKHYIRGKKKQIRMCTADVNMYGTPYNYV
jgi:hypothetical protein